jgi:hypothetical protein
MYHQRQCRQCPSLPQYHVLRHRALRRRVHSLRQSDLSLQYRAVHCRIGRWQGCSRSPILAHRLYLTTTHANLLIMVPSRHGMASSSGVFLRLGALTVCSPIALPNRMTLRSQSAVSSGSPLLPAHRQFPRFLAPCLMEYVFPVLNSYISSSSPDVQISSPTISQAMANGPIQYPQIARTLVPHNSGSSFNGSVGNYGIVSPPQASLHPTLSRRRSEYQDQSREALALTGAGFRASIDYPDLSSQHILRPPPIAAAPKERPRNHAHAISLPPPPPTIPSEYPVTYWGDVQIGTMGLKNLGNTCYMNSTIQCLSATVPFARFFTGELSVFFVV